MLTAYEMVAAGLPIVVNDVADLRQNIGHLSTVHIVGDSEANLRGLSSSAPTTPLRARSLKHQQNSSHRILRGRNSVEGL